MWLEALGRDPRLAAAPLAPEIAWAIRSARAVGTPTFPSVVSTRDVVSVMRIEPKTARPKLPPK
jgi:hypothetical protein